MITVDSIKLGAFMLHEKTDLVLPAKGVVLVTGANGEGKSALVEGVAYALWGKTLRGEDPWEDGTPCFAGVQMGDVAVVRKRLKTKAKVHISAEGIEEYHTASKAQKWIDENIGTRDLWLRTCVFSTTTPQSKFSSATDKERKLLLEGILELSKFDVGLKLARDEYRDAKKRADAIETMATTATMRREGARKRLADARTAQEFIVPTPPSPDEGSEIDERIAKLEALVSEAKRHVEDATVARAEWDATMRELKRKLAAVDKDECPTCTQAIAQDVKDSAQQALDEALAKMQSNPVLQALADWRDRRDAVAAELQEAIAEQRAYDKAKADYEADAPKRARMKQAIEEAEAEIAACDKELADLHEQAEAVEHEVAVLGVCGQVLGLRGVRAQILARALSAIELSANAWLRKLGGEGYALKLEPYTEKKAGGTNDAISLRVRHPKRSHWHPYAACSQGQARRFDAAMVFALSDFARASMGVEGGTLFIDEVFDTLDADGIQRVCEVLEEIGRTRCVMVITHNEDFKKQLTAVRHLRVEDGKVA